VNRQKVIESVRYIMAGPRWAELQRLDAIADALKPWTPYQAQRQLTSMGRREEPLPGLKWRSQTNFLPLVVDVYSQSMKVDNYLASDTKETADVPWQWWQRNKFDARQTGIIRSVLTYGASYVTVLPSLNPMSPQTGAFLRGLSPRQMTCLYGEPMEWTPGETPVDDDWPIMALEIKDSAIRLYDDENVYFVGVENVPKSALGWTEPTYSGVNNFKYLDARPHNVGVCPVVRFRDRWLLDGEEAFGVVEPLLSIQSRIDETTYEMLVSQYFTAFTQRWVTGWRPKDDGEALAAVAGDVWYFSKSDVNVGQFSQGDINGYIDSKQSAVRDLAAIGQIPAQNLGIDAMANISEATLAGLETAKKRKTAEIQTALGESFEQMLRTCAYIVGDRKGSEDFGSEVKWSDLTARTLAETVDALGKMAQMLDVPTDILIEDVPNKTKAWVDRVIAAKENQPEPPPPPVAPEFPAEPPPDVPPGGAIPAPVAPTPGG
jgi:hypothetical protein